MALEVSKGSTGVTRITQITTFLILVVVVITILTIIILSTRLLLLHTIMDHRAIISRRILLLLLLHTCTEWETTTIRRISTTLYRHRTTISIIIIRRPHTTCCMRHMHFRLLRPHLRLHENSPNLKLQMVRQTVLQAQTILMKMMLHHLERNFILAFQIIGRKVDQVLVRLLLLALILSLSRKWQLRL